MDHSNVNENRNQSSDANISNETEANVETPIVMKSFAETNDDPIDTVEIEKESTKDNDNANDTKVEINVNDDVDIEMGNSESAENTSSSSSLSSSSELPHCVYCPILGTILQNPMVGSNGISYEQSAIETKMMNNKRNSNMKGNNKTADSDDGNDTESSDSSTTATLHEVSLDESNNDITTVVLDCFHDEFYYNRALFQLLQDGRFRQQQEQDDALQSRFLRRLSSVGSTAWKHWQENISQSFRVGGGAGGETPSTEFVNDLEAPNNNINDNIDEDFMEDDDQVLPDAYYCPITFNLMQDPVIDPEGNTFERIAVHHWIQRHGSSPITRTPLTTDDLYPNTSLLQLLQYDVDQYWKRQVVAKQPLHSSIMEWKKFQDNPDLLQTTIPSSSDTDDNNNGTLEQRQARAERRRARREEQHRQQQRQQLVCGLACFALFIFYMALIWITNGYHLAVFFMIIIGFAMVGRNRLSPTTSTSTSSTITEQRRRP